MLVVTVTVLIQSADYVQLLMDDLVSISAISAPDGVTVTGIEVENSECLVASSFTWYALSLSPSAHPTIHSAIHSLSLCP